MALQQWYTEQPAVSRSVGLTLCLVLVHCPSSALPPTNHSFHLRTARAYLASYKINTTPLSTLLPHSQYVLLFLGLARARTYFFPAPTSTAVIPPFSPTYPPHICIYFFISVIPPLNVSAATPRTHRDTRTEPARLFRAFSAPLLFVFVVPSSQYQTRENLPEKSSLASFHVFRVANGCRHQRLHLLLRRPSSVPIFAPTRPLTLLTPLTPFTPFTCLPTARPMNDQSTTDQLPINYRSTAGRA